MALPTPSPTSTAVVTGASSGIGTDIARELADRGHGVTLVARREDRLRDLAAELAGRVRVEVIACDVADSAARAALFDEVARRGLTVDILVNNAGIGTIGSVTKSPVADEIAQVRVNVEAVIDLTTRAIQQMNRESRRLFEETFAAVDAKFREIFPRMFRGGRAELRLTNPEDMLETGIDIIAQPPGKKLSSIELMSGGEKALTAVSLVFAIFQIKPSPFCILDEVDAPLDEANVARYNDIIRSMTDRSQFILITHIKRTMQMVDVLYGVTMPEAGVSKIVSVRMNDTAQTAKTMPSEPAAAVA